MSVIEDTYRELIRIDPEGAKFFSLNLSKIGSGELSKSYRASLNDLIRKRNSLNTLIKYLTQKGVSSRELASLKRYLTVITESERDLRAEEKLIEEYERKKREDHEEEIMGMRRELKEKLDHQQKELARMLKTRLELEEALKIKQEINDLFKLAMESRERLSILSREYQNNLVKIEDNRSLIKQSWGKVLASDYLEKLYEQFPNIPRNIIREKAEECWNDDMSSDDYSTDLAKALGVDKEIIEAVNESSSAFQEESKKRDFCKSENQDTRIHNQEIEFEFREEEEKLGQILSAMDGGLEKLQGTDLLDELLAKREMLGSPISLTSGEKTASHISLQTDPLYEHDVLSQQKTTSAVDVSEAGIDIHQEQIPDEDEGLMFILSRDVEKISKKYSEEIETQEKFWGLTSSEEDIIGPIEKSVVEDLASEQLGIKEPIMEDEVDEVVDSRVEELQKKVDLLVEKQELLNIRLEEIAEEISKAEDQEDEDKLEELMDLQDEAEENLESCDTEIKKLTRELNSIQSNQPVRKTNHRLKWINKSSDSEPKLDSKSKPKSDIDPESESEDHPPNSP